MRGASLGFILSAVVFGTIGMAWGIVMAATHDHMLSPAHAHLNLIGWVTMALFGFYYHAVPSASARRVAGAPLPWIHFAVSFAGVVTIAPGIAMAVSGGTEGLAILGSFLTIGGMGIFLITVALDALGKRAADAVSGDAIRP